MLFEAFCIFGSHEFYNKLLCILVKVNKTMNGNSEDFPKKVLDNVYPELRICDITFAVVGNVIAADENNIVN
jgi:hypothetical protein